MYWFIIAFILSGISVFMGCGGVKSGAQQPNVGQTAAPVTPPRPMGLQLQNRDMQQDRASRVEFLRNTQVQQVRRTGGSNAFLLNQQLIRHQNLSSFGAYENAYPISPIVQSYNMNLIPIEFGAKFPISFAANLPASVRDALNARTDIEAVEIFFTPQFSASIFVDNDPSIKGHFWATPEAPATFGDLYNKALPMAIFESDYDIQRDVRSGTFKSVQVITHAGTYSPPNEGGLALAPTSSWPLSFWSIVVEPERRRAAVTLHWLVDSTSAEGAFTRALDAAVTSSQRFPDLVSQWDTIPDLRGTPLMAKLKQLIQQ